MSANYAMHLHFYWKTCTRGDYIYVCWPQGPRVFFESTIDIEVFVQCQEEAQKKYLCVHGPKKIFMHVHFQIDEGTCVYVYLFLSFCRVYITHITHTHTHGIDSRYHYAVLSLSAPALWCLFMRAKCILSLFFAYLTLGVVMFLRSSALRHGVNLRVVDILQLRSSISNFKHTQCVPFKHPL